MDFTMIPSVYVFCGDLMLVTLYHRFVWADTHASPAIIEQRKEEHSSASLFQFIYD